MSILLSQNGCNVLRFCHIEVLDAHTCDVHCGPFVTAVPYVVHPVFLSFPVFLLQLRNLHVENSGS